MLNLLISSRKTGSAVVEFATVKAAVSVQSLCWGWHRTGDSQDTALSLRQWRRIMRVKRHGGSGTAGGTNPEIRHINRLCMEQAEGRGTALKIRH